MPGRLQVLLAFILSGFLGGEVAYGQNYLILQRGANEKTRLVYEVGDELVYLQKGLDYYIRDNIREIGQDILILEENVLSLEQIEAVDIRNKDERNRTLANVSFLSMAAGGMLLLAGGINSLYSEGRLSYSSETLTTAGGLLGAGLLFQPLRYKRFKLKGRNKIQTILLETSGEK
ncbi:hypothetical protein [Cyclobacterium xiamenense]|uniref:hypothetical protein n=1 Tax=Cyclobacterium xiamenense TaxID=1297121 RepID=UPI0012B8C4E8|nr:hypothetical protein [Cyclobacterium xiamenense]